jgi:hypothetical protein
MPSYEFDIGERERAGSRFISAVNSELQRVLAEEKTHRALTQQAIATKLEVNRSVVHRMLMGLENMTSRSIGELLWAMGWEPHFEARRLSAADGQNEIVIPPQITNSSSTTVSDQPKILAVAA